MLIVHEHPSTGVAYDASNCEDDHAKALVLIPSERVVGFAWAWPIAVTHEAGALHSPRPGQDRDGMLALLADAGYTLDDARQAVALCDEHGFEVSTEFLSLVGEGRA
jgi:hypothetical protein